MARGQDSSIPIYQKLFDHYREQILSFRLKPGDRVDSINEIQARHGVARETAKRVLSMLARQGLIIQRPGKGSFVADQSPRKKIWGLVFPFYSVQYEDLIRCVTEQAHALGRKVKHFCDYNNYQEEMRLVGQMLKDAYDGIIVIPTMDESRTWDFYSRLPKGCPPVILLDHTMIAQEFRYVVQTYDLGVTRAVRYLLSHTDKGIAFVENDVWAGRNMVLELMRGTYLDMMRKWRPDFEPVVLPGAAQVDRRRLAKSGVGALFCCDDIGAIQAIGRLKEQGASVPGDIALASYGNTDLARFFTPPISSVDPRNAEMAQLLAAMLSPGEQADHTKQEHVVLPELIVRET